MTTSLSLADTEINSLVLAEIARMPEGGGYATTRQAHQALLAAVPEKNQNLAPRQAQPSYCSGATYLVFVQVMQQLERRQRIALAPETWTALRPVAMPDGQGLWGRWNANGPGTARLFHELQLGRNFTSYAEARPGDFMKIFWSRDVGKKERGHSVVYLGTEQRPDGEYVRFWSSNKPTGYGEKAVAKSKIAAAIFSRLETPQNISTWSRIPKKDTYLASLLSRESSLEEAHRLSGVRD